MKKSFLSLAVVASAAGLIYAAAPKDPVLMTVGGKPVTLSEFEYLYHKNNSQQLVPQTIDEYLQMFITYKQKVAAAEAAGIDTTQAFQSEFDGYRRELAEPYLSVKAVEDSIIAAEYDRMGTDVDVSHIMVRFQAPDGTDQRALLAAVRDSIVNMGADFAAMADKYSVDPAVTSNHGHMGYITAARFPYKFEDAAYQTPVGQISDVIDTPVGYHIVKVHGTRPARGQVLVEHILKLTRGLPEDEAARKKAQIDSIYQVLKGGADFAEVAKTESEDPGSARRGGQLPWFGTGQMVPEFETAAFDLAVGEISEPVQTSFGYHIIKKLDAKGRDSLAAVAPMIKNVISRDERGQLAHRRKLDQLMQKFKVTRNEQAIAKAVGAINSANGIDSTVIAGMLTDNTPLARANGKDLVLVSEFAADLQPGRGQLNRQLDEFDRMLTRSIDNAVLELEREDLAVNNVDYRNLLNEYRDGMLLFEVSDREVWSKAKQDKQGLENYFNANRDKYTWKSPKLKSYVIFATSDSICKAAEAYLAANKVAPDSLVTEMRKHFGRDIKVEKVIAAQGENAITDYIAFGGEKPEQKGKWAYYFPYLNRVVPAPEEAADERGQVTTDYQGVLEEAWKKELAKKYPAKVNKKVLKKAK